jgi:predicted permease
VGHQAVLAIPTLLGHQEFWADSAGGLSFNILRVCHFRHVQTSARLAVLAHSTMHSEVRAHPVDIMDNVLGQSVAVHGGIGKGWRN